MSAKLVDTDTLRETMVQMSLKNTVADENVLRIPTTASSIYYSFGFGVATDFVYVRVSKHGNALFVWIGNEDGGMNNLCVSVPTPYDARGGGYPSATQIMGIPQSVVNALACKMAKKLQKPCFVSYNIQKPDLHLCDIVTKKVFDEICKFPENF